MPKPNKIRKDKFKAYQAVRGSGITNMFSIANVIAAAEVFSDVELTKKDCISIMCNYRSLEKEYGK